MRYPGGVRAGPDPGADQGGPSGRPRAGKDGRPPALEEGDIKLAQRLIQDPDVPVETICERLGISSATLHRYVCYKRAETFNQYVEEAGTFQDNTAEGIGL